MIFPKSFFANGFKVSRFATSSLMFVPRGTKNLLIASKSPAKEASLTSFKYGKSDGKMRLKITLPTEVIQ